METPPVHPDAERGGEDANRAGDGARDAAGRPTDGATGADADRRDAENRDANDPDANDPDARGPDANDPDANDPDANDPDANNPDANNPDADNPDAVPVPPEFCTGPGPSDRVAPAPAECMTCPGAPMPGWRLMDFQTQSCGVGQRYGLTAFTGRATVVALFSASCGYCQSQAQQLERMRNELEEEQIPAYFVAINTVAATAAQDRLVERCAFPLFQDTDEDGAFAAHQGATYDFFIYRPDGKLHVYLPNGGDVSTTLSTEEGYNNIRSALVEAAGQ